jgi:nitrite reductase/ring-hydroxylating ferredoxin subunit/uncharacterized membrane protein
MPTHITSRNQVVDETIERSTVLKKGGTEVKHQLHKAILSSGPLGRFFADLLHGKWLGHPLHPVLTDVTLGAWLSGSVLDIAGRMTGRRRMNEAADTLIELGTASAIPTALAGLTDYSTIKQDAVEYGAAHALMNSVALSLFVLSIQKRRTRERETAVMLSLAGVSLSMLSAWLGGEMVYRHRVGVNHAKQTTHLDDWTPVMASHMLQNGVPQRVDLEGDAVLLYRQGETVYAIGAVCAHAGGPLEEGTFEGSCVTCPWHDSVYDLRDGSVVHGPSTFSVPHYHVREANGQIEIKAAS